MGNQQVSLENLIPIPSLEGYFIDEDVNVYSTVRTKEPKRLNPHKHFVKNSSKPYLRVMLRNRLWLVHRLALMAYLGRPLKPDETVNHRNGITTDNSRGNLEVATHAEQVAHAARTGLYCSGSDWYKARGLVPGTGKKPQRLGHTAQTGL